jgi:hypothetical protein
LADPSRRPLARAPQDEGLGLATEPSSWSSKSFRKRGESQSSVAKKIQKTKKTRDFLKIRAVLYPIMSFFVCFNLKLWRSRLPMADLAPARKIRGAVDFTVR